MLSDRCAVRDSRARVGPLFRAEFRDPHRDPRWARRRASGTARRQASWRGARTRTARAPASRSAVARSERPPSSAVAASGERTRTGTGRVPPSSRTAWLEVPSVRGHVKRRPAVPVVRVAVRPRDPVPVVHAIGPHGALAPRVAVVVGADARINLIRTGVRHLLLVSRVCHDGSFRMGKQPFCYERRQIATSPREGHCFPWKTERLPCPGVYFVQNRFCTKCTTRRIKSQTTDGGREYIGTYTSWTCCSY